MRPQDIYLLIYLLCYVVIICVCVRAGRDSYREHTSRLLTIWFRCNMSSGSDDICGQLVEALQAISRRRLAGSFIHSFSLSLCAVFDFIVVCGSRYQGRIMVPPGPEA